MLLFIHLCNWDNLWNPAAWLLVWWCWNAIAKLTVVSFPGFSIPSVSWFSGNKVQDLLFPCLACCARFSPHQTSASFLCPFLGGIIIFCLASPVVTHSHSALCACYFTLPKCGSCSNAEMVVEHLQPSESDINIWRLKLPSLCFCTYFCRFLVSWALLKSDLSKKEALLRQWFCNSLEFLYSWN